MSTINIFQVSLEIWGCLICMIVGTVFGNKVYNMGGALKRIWMMLLINSLMLSCDSFAYVFRGDIRSFGIYMTRISNFGLFLTEGVLTFQYVGMVHALITGQEKISKKESWVKLCLVCIALQILGVLVTPFTEFYYSFNQMNNYQREVGIFLSFVALGIAFVVSSFQLFRNKASFSPNLWGAIRLSLLIFLICFLVQLRNYGFSLINIGITVVLLLLFANLWYDVQRKEHEKQLEALEQTIHELLESQYDKK